MTGRGVAGMMERGVAGMTGRGVDSKMEPGGLVFVFEDETQGDVAGGDRLAVAEAGSVAGGGDAAFGAAAQGGLFGRVDGLYPDVGGPAGFGYVEQGVHVVAVFCCFYLRLARDGELFYGLWFAEQFIRQRRVGVVLLPGRLRPVDTGGRLPIPGVVRSASRP